MKKILISLLLAMTLVFSCALVACSEESPAFFTHTLTFSVNGTGGTVDVTDIELFGEKVTYKVDGNKIYAGAKTVTATADEGYEFSAWSRPNGTYELIDEAIELKASFKKAGSEPISGDSSGSDSSVDSGSQSGGDSSGGQEPGFETDPNTYYVAFEFQGTDGWEITANHPTLNTLEDDENNYASYTTPLFPEFTFKIYKGDGTWIEWNQTDETNLELVDFDIKGNAIVKAMNTYDIFVSKDGMAYIALHNEAWEADVDTYYLAGTFMTIDMWTVNEYSPTLTILEEDENNVAVLENILLTEGDTLKIVKGADNWIEWNKENETNAALAEFDILGNAAIKETALYNLYVSKDGMAYIAKVPAIVEMFTITVMDGLEDEAPMEDTYEAGATVTIDGNKITIVDSSSETSFEYTPTDSVHNYFVKFVNEDEEDYADGEFTLNGDITIIAITAAYPEGYYLVGTQTEVDWAYSDDYKFVALEEDPDENIASIIGVELVAEDEVKVRYLNQWISIEANDLVTILDGGNAQIKEAGKYNFYINKEGKAYIEKYVAPPTKYNVKVYDGAIDAENLLLDVDYIEDAAIVVDGESLSINDGVAEEYVYTNTSESFIASFKAGENALTGTSALKADLVIVILHEEVLEGYFLAGTMTDTAWAFSADYKFGEPVEDLENEAELIEVSLAKDAKVKVRVGKDWIAVEADDLVTIDDDGNAVIKEEGKYNFYINAEGKAYIAKFVPSYNIAIYDTFYGDEEPLEEFDEIYKEGAVIIIDGENIYVKKTADATGYVYQNGSLDDTHYVSYVLKGETAEDDKVLTGTTTLTEDMVIYIVYEEVPEGYYLAGTMSEDAWSYDADYKFGEPVEDPENEAELIEVSLAKDAKVKVRVGKEWIAVEADDLVTIDEEGNAVIKEEGKYNFYINEGKAYIAKFVPSYSVKVYIGAIEDDKLEIDELFLEGATITIEGDLLTIEGGAYYQTDCELDGYFATFTIGETVIKDSATVTGDTVILVSYTEVPEGYYLAGTMSEDAWSFDDDYKFGAAVEDTENEAELIEVSLAAEAKVKVRYGKTWIAVEANEELVTIDEEGNAVIKAEGKYNFYINEGKAYIAKFVPKYTVSLYKTAASVEADEEILFYEGATITVEGEKLTITDGKTTYTSPETLANVVVSYRIGDVDFEGNASLLGDIKIYFVSTELPEGYYLVGTMTDTAWAFNPGYKFTEVENEDEVAILNHIELAADTKVKVRNLKVWTAIEANDLIEIDDDGNAIIKVDGFYNLYINKEGKATIEAFVEHYTVKFFDGATELTEKAQYVAENTYATFVEYVEDSYHVIAWQLEGVDFDFANTPITEDIELYAVWAWFADANSYYLVGKINGAEYNWEVTPETIKFVESEGNLGAAFKVALKKGDIIKVRNGGEGEENGEKWYEWADEDEDTMALLEIVDMGGGINAKVKADGKYDIYLANDGLVYITGEHFTVKFVDEDGTTELADAQSIVTGLNAEVPTTVPTKEGYEFVMWGVPAEPGAEEAYEAFDFANTAITADTVLYAVWFEIEEGYYLVGTMTEKDWSVVASIAGGYVFDEIDDNEDPNAYELIKAAVTEGDKVKIRTADTWLAIEANEDLVTIDDDGNAVIKKTGVYDFFITKEGKAYISKTQYTITLLQGQLMIFGPKISVYDGETIETPICALPGGGNMYVTAWTMDGLEAFDFANTPITEDIILYPYTTEWIPVEGTVFVLGSIGGSEFTTEPDNDTTKLEAMDGYVGALTGIELLQGDLIKLRLTTTDTWYAWDAEDAKTLIIAEIDENGYAKILEDGIYDIYLKAVTDGEETVYLAYLTYVHYDVEFITYVDGTNDLVAAPAQSVEEGENAVEPEVSREGYDFVRWYVVDGAEKVDFDFTTVIYNDTTVYAEWFLIPEGTYLVGTMTEKAWAYEEVPDSDPVAYKFAFKALDAQAENAAELIKVELAKDTELKVRIEGVWTNVEAEETLIEILENGNAKILEDGEYNFYVNKEGKVYIAKYIYYYDVKFVDEDGTTEISTKQTIAKGEKATDPKLTKGDYSATAWMLGDDVFDFETPITADITLKVVWTWNMAENGLYVVGGVNGQAENWEVTPASPKLDKVVEGYVAAALDVELKAGDVIKIRVNNVDKWYQWDWNDEVTISLVEVVDQGGANNALVLADGIYDIYLTADNTTIITKQHFNVYFYEEGEVEPEEIADAQRVAKGNKATDPEVKKEGYDLIRWYTINDQTQKVDFSFDTEILEETVVYAEWFKIPEGTYLVGTMTEKAWAYEEVPESDPVAYKFAFKALDAQAENEAELIKVEIAKDTELKVRIEGVWTNIEAEETLVEILENGNAKILADGEYNFYVNKEGKVYIAKYIYYYTVKFVDEDGTTEVATAQTIEKGKTATDPKAKKGDYSATSWTLSGSEYDFATAVTADITLKAVWGWSASETDYYIVGIIGGEDNENWNVVEGCTKLLADEDDQENLAKVLKVEFGKGDIIKIRKGDATTWIDWAFDEVSLELVDVEDMGGALNAKFKADGIYSIYISKADNKAYITAEFVTFTIDGVEHNVVKGSTYDIVDGTIIFSNFTVDAALQKGYVFTDWCRKIDEEHSTTYDNGAYVANEDMTFVSFSEEAFTTVIYYNEKQWDDVYAYVWDKDAETDAEAAEWPGLAMTAKDEEGEWWEVTFSAHYDMIIFNNGDGTQTPDVSVKANKNVYSFGSWYATVDEAIDAMLTVYVEAYYYEPGEEDFVLINTLVYNFKDEVSFTSDGTYIYADTKQIKIPLGPDEYAYMVLNGAVYEMNTTVQIRRDSLLMLYTLVDGEPLPTEFKYLNGATTVYYYNVNNWEDVYAYTWISATEPDAEVNAAWPGAKMTAVVGQEGWFSYTFEADIFDKIIFNDGNGGEGNQTADLDVPTDDNVYFNGDEWISDFPMTVYFYNAEGWENVYAYLMNTLASTENKTYPGEAMTAVEGKDGWFSYTFYGDFTKITFNPGNVPMNGVALPTDENVYYYDGGWYNDFVTPVTVYFYNIKGWENVGVYAYDSNDSDIKNDYWPGVQMTAVEGKDGWYSYTFPSGLYDVIRFNSNKDGGEAWPDESKVPTDENVYFNNGGWYNDFVTFVTVYYYDEGNWENVNAYVWKDISLSESIQKAGWPGEAMTAVEGKDGWYSYTFIDIYDSIQFNNGGNGGVTDNLDVPTDGKVYFYKGEWYDDFVSEITVYFYDEEDWYIVYAYAWKGGLDLTQNNDWPGVPMTPVAGTDGWYSYTFVEGAFENIIFNGAGGQTADLTIPTDENVYFKGTNWQAHFEVVTFYTVTIKLLYWDPIEQEVIEESHINQVVEEGTIITVGYYGSTLIIEIGEDELYNSDDNLDVIYNVDQTGNITVDSDLFITVTIGVDF